MASDDAADMLGELAPEEAEKMLQLIDEDERIDFGGLLRYPEDSA